MTTALRSFLNYARYRGEVVLDLAAAVPAVANWSMPSIPVRFLQIKPICCWKASVVKRRSGGATTPFYCYLHDWGCAREK